MMVSCANDQAVEPRTLRCAHSSQVGLIRQMGFAWFWMCALLCSQHSLTLALEEQVNIATGRSIPSHRLTPQEWSGSEPSEDPAPLPHARKLTKASDAGSPTSECSSHLDCSSDTYCRDDKVCYACSDCLADNMTSIDEACPSKCAVKKCSSYTFIKSEGEPTTKKVVRFLTRRATESEYKKAADPNMITIPMSGTPESQANLMAHFAKKLGLLDGVRNLNMHHNVASTAVAPTPVDEV